MTTATLPTRAYPADEITRDPIFLLQRRHWTFGGEPRGWRWDSDLEALVSVEDPERQLSTYEEIRAEDFDEVVTWWETDSVWFTRAEATRFAKRTAYNFPHGWRVYCLCAEGALAKLLAAVTVREQPAS